MASCRAGASDRIHRDAREVVQRFDRDALAARQRVMRGQHHHDRLTQQLDDLEAVGGAHRAAHEGDVERAALQPLERIHGVLAVQHDAQVRQVRGDQRAQRRQDAHIRGWKRAHGQVAGATVGGLLREAAGVVDAAEDVLRFAQEDAPGVGQRHVVTAAIEQHDADRRLELANLLAE